MFLSDSSQEQLKFVTTNAVPDVSGCVSTEDCVLECVLLTNDALLVVGEHPLFLPQCKKQKAHLSHHVFCVSNTLRPHAPPHFIVNLDLTLKHKISKFEKGASDKNSRTVHHSYVVDS